MNARCPRRADAAIFAMIAAVLLAVPVRAEAPTQNEAETALTCQCGCGLTVHSCNHLNCGSAIPLKKEISQQIDARRSLEEILAYFENKYGEKILSAPTTRGFNLAAWVVPFVMIGIGGLFVAVVLRRWRTATGSTPSTPEPGPADPAERALRERLERELRERDA